MHGPVSMSFEKDYVAAHGTLPPTWLLLRINYLTISPLQLASGPWLMDDIICRGLKDGDLALVHPGSSAPGWFASLALFPFFSFPFSCLFPSCLANCLSRLLLLFSVCILCFPSTKHDSASAFSYNSQGKLTTKNGEFYIRIAQFYFRMPHFEG